MRQKSLAVFTEGREKVSEDNIKMDIAESFAAFPLVRFYVDVHVPESALVAERASLAALLKLVDCLLGLKKAGGINRRGLLRQQADHFALFLAAYGEEHVIPKHHATYHVVERYGRFEELPDCICLERKHTKAKAYANVFKSSSGLVKLVLFSSLLDQRRVLDSDCLSNKLVGLLSQKLLLDGRLAQTAKQVHASRSPTHDVICNLPVVEQ